MCLKWCQELTDGEAERSKQDLCSLGSSDLKDKTNRNWEPLSSADPSLPPKSVAPHSGCMRQSTGHVASFPLANWSNISACSGHVINVTFTEAARPFLLFTSFHPAPLISLQSLLLLPWFEPSDLRIRRNLGMLQVSAHAFPKPVPGCLPTSLAIAHPLCTMGLPPQLPCGRFIHLAQVDPLCLPEVRAQDNPDSSFELQPVRYWNYSYYVPFQDFLLESKYFQFLNISKFK